MQLFQYRYRIQLLTFLGIAVATANANATLLSGQQVDFDVASPSKTTSIATWGPLTVGTNPAVTSTSNGNVVNFTLSIFDSQFVLSYPGAKGFNNPTFNGYVLTAVSPTIPAFTGASIDPSTTLIGFDLSRLSFDAIHIYANVSGLSARAGDVLAININPVPEPSSVILLGLSAGVAGLGVCRRYRFRRGPAGEPH